TARPSRVGSASRTATLRQFSLTSAVLRRRILASLREAEGTGALSLKLTPCCRTPCSPSPQPSPLGPLGRGRNVCRMLANPTRVGGLQCGIRNSLSLRERVRVGEETVRGSFPQFFPGRR